MWSREIEDREEEGDGESAQDRGLAGWLSVDGYGSNHKAGELRNGCIDPLFRAVDGAEADALRALIVQDFEGVAVKDRDDGAGEVGGPQFARSHEQIKYSYRN